MAGSQIFSACLKQRSFICGSGPFVYGECVPVKAILQSKMLSHWAKQHSGYIARESSGLLLDSAYFQQAASLEAALLAWGNPRCYYPLAKLKSMGRDGRGSKLKVLVGGGMQSIRVPG